MEHSIPIFIALAAVLVLAGVAGVIYSFYAAGKRRDALRAWAAARELSFRPDHVYSMDTACPAVKCLNDGHSRYAHNVMEGRWHGRSFRAFDYHYETGSGKDETTHNLSVVVLGCAFPLRPLLIRKEYFTDRLADFVGFHEIKFESAEFGREFHISSPDRKWAYDVLHPRAMEFLLSMPRFEIQFDLLSVAVHRTALFKPEDFEAAAKVAQGLLDGLPEYVKQEQQEGSAQAKVEPPGGTRT